MTVRPHTHNARVLLGLRDGKWHSSADLQRRVGPTARINSRVNELRRKHKIPVEHRCRKASRRALQHQYRLPDPDTIDWASIETVSFRDPSLDGRTILNRDEVPRDKKHRFRFYRLYLGELELVGTASNECGVGRKLIELGRNGEFSESCVGLLDTFGIDKTVVTGKWVLNPWDSESRS